MHEIPRWWQTTLEEIEQAAQSARKAQIMRLCHTPGGRPVTAFAYGEKQDIVSQANYSSACGAHEVGCYAPKAGKKPVVILLR